jgi:hypothetical protein
LKNNVDIDSENNIVALWHDESHLNKYILDRNDLTILSPAYCYPENIFDYRKLDEIIISYKCNLEKAKLQVIPKVVLRDKSKYINTIAVKKTGVKRYVTVIKVFIKKLLVSKIFCK